MLDHLNRPLCPRFNNGSEKLSPPDWYHAGQCLYVFPFHISNPGKLTLDITHLYDNFGAVVEQSDGWPVLTQKKVVSNLPLEVCRGCPSRVAAPRFQQEEQESSTDGKDTVPVSGAIAKNLYLAYATKGKTRLEQSDKGLPPCSKDLAVQGIWLPAHPTDKQSWRRANYTWTPLGCTFGKPLDPACLERKKKASKILFQGDNHLRVAMEHLLQRLKGSTTILNSTTTAAEKMSETIGSTTLMYMHDPMFTQTGEKTDLLVGNMGHAATGTKFMDQLWTTSNFHDRLRDMVDRVQQQSRDLQDLEDEDEDATRRFLDGEYGSEADDDDGHDEDEEEEDEEELEFEHELLRQEKQKTPTVAESIEVYWADETEEENVSSPFSDEELEQLEEQEEEERLRREALQEELDMIEDRYRVAERYRAEQGGYGVRERYRDSDATSERARLRYPNNHVLRQSKYHKTPEQANSNDRKSNPRPRPLYRNVGQRKPLHGESDKLGRASEGKSAATSSSRRVRDSSKTSNGRKVERTMRGTSRPSGSNEITSGRSSDSQIGRPSRENFREPYAYNNRRTTQPINLNLGDTKSKDSKEEREEIPIQSKNNNLNDKSSASSSTGYRMLHKRAQHSSSPSVDNIHDHKQQELPLKMAWAGMVAYPETQPVSDPMLGHDWRSIYRLRYWNQIAEEVMLLHNVRFMDFFSMTLSMLDTSPDRGHYFGTDAAEAMLDEMSYKLGLCAEDEAEDSKEQ
ncbi:hypothetical protein EMPS_09433 [Entomortierella parvispora]|uniref:Uncharacterized protein n=1 Tax=Entomortierella parvispora TaxID=205924 RepID=A0A9P3HHZ1_9FUNG|nr:hypothetical protein EMPS_09433 [Entomortierella parvispora]